MLLKSVVFFVVSLVCCVKNEKLFKAIRLLVCNKLFFGDKNEFREVNHLIAESLTGKMV